MSTASAPTTHPQGVFGFINRALTTSLGAKLVMAISGILLYGWLILHLLGNLAVFAGPEMMNTYAFFLKNNPELLWPMRIGLLALIAAHIVSAARVSAMNRAARPVPYEVKRWRQATFASRTMLVSGVIVLGFIVFHLAHFTTGDILTEYFERTYQAADGRVIPDVHQMVALGFRNDFVVLIYLVGVGLVGLHLSHGVWSALQTLGLNGKKWTPFAIKLGLVLGFGLALLLLTIPIAIYFDFGAWEYVQ